MGITIGDKQDRKNRLIIESSLISPNQRGYLLQEATDQMRQVAAEQIRYQMSTVLVL
jgi:hypothetical protein